MDDLEKAKLEIQNGFAQYDLAIEMLQYYMQPNRPFALRPGLVQELQAKAVMGIEPNAGEFRTTKVGITKSNHVPPEPFLVKGLVTEMCDYVNDNLHEKPPFHLAAYLMWRHNWIHPFTDGNGRTSRTLSYLVLSLVLGYELPGTPTIPFQIEQDRRGYFAALEAADASALKGEMDLSVMENMLKNMLAKQLLSVVEAATGESLT